MMLTTTTNLESPMTTPNHDPLPSCPCCTAPAQGGAWRDLFDLQHECDCILERTLEYERGLERLWRVRQRRRDYFGSLPERYQRYRLEQLEPNEGNKTALAAVSSFAPGDSLYLWGAPGNGKTHLACGLGAQLLEVGSVRFFNLAALFARLRECVAHDLPKPNLQTPDVLILDDLGKVKASEFVYEVMYACLEGRWSNGKTTILTANHKPGVVADRLTPTSFDRPAADALLSRLVAGRVIEVKGEDRREGRA